MPQLPPAPLPAQHRGHATSAPHPQGKADLLLLGAQTTFKALGDRREVMPRAGHHQNPTTRGGQQHRHGGSYTDAPRHAHGRHDDFLEQSQGEQLRRWWQGDGCWNGNLNEPMSSQFFALTMTLCLQLKLFFMTENIDEAYKILHYNKWNRSGTFLFLSQ